MSDSENKIWYIYVDNMQYGPLSKDNLIYYIQNGSISKKDYIWNDIKQEWQLAENVEEFMEYFSEPATEFEKKIEIPDILKLNGTKIYYRSYKDGEKIKERAFKRLNIFLPAEIRLKNSEDKNFHTVKVENISACGIGIEAKYLELKLNDEIEVRVFISSIGKFITILGKVVRLKIIIKNPIYLEAGIKFTDIEKEDGKFLIEVLSWKCSYYQAH